MDARGTVFPPLTNVDFLSPAINQGDFNLVDNNQEIDAEFLPVPDNRIDLSASIWDDATFNAVNNLLQRTFGGDLAAALEPLDGSFSAPLPLDPALGVDPQNLLLSNAAAAQQHGGIISDAGDGDLPAQPLAPAPFPQVPVANAAIARQQGGIIPNAANGMIQQQQQPPAPAAGVDLLPAGWEHTPLRHDLFGRLPSGVPHELAFRFGKTQHRLWSEETYRLARRPAVRDDYERARKESKYYNQLKNRYSGYLARRQ